MRPGRTSRAGRPVTALDTIEGRRDGGGQTWSTASQPGGPRRRRPGQAEAAARAAARAGRRSPPPTRALAGVKAELAPGRGRARQAAPAGLVYAGTVHNGGGAAFRGTGPDGGKPRPIHVLAGATSRAPGPRSARAPSTCMPELPGALRPSAGHAEGDRRAALARWLTDPRNAAGLAIDRQPGLAVPLRPRDRRHAQRLRPNGSDCPRIPSCSTGSRSSSATAASRSRRCTG